MAVYVSDLLTAIPAPVDVAPASAQTWQWLRSSTAISGATGGTYTTTLADLGTTLAVTQTETNFLGAASATSANTEVVQAYDPNALFRFSEPGVWFDPNDITTLYKGPSPQLPVTAPGDTVWLMLDKSKGLALGPEKVTNGTFVGNSTAGWVAGFGLVNGTFTASEGVATLTQGSSDTAPRFVTTLTGLIVGNTYRVSFTAVGQSGAGDKYVVWTSLANGTGGSTLNLGSGWTGQELTYFLAATATTMYVAVGLNGGTTGTTASIDNISVREVPGNHATQPTLASQPTYGIVPAGGRRNILVFSQEFENAAWNAGGQRMLQVTANAATAPDGTTTAEKVFEAAPSAGSVTQNVITLGAIPAGINTLSVYAKKAERKRIFLFVNGLNQGAWFDLDTGAFAADGSGATASIQNVGNGWYRCSLTTTPATAGSFFLQVVVIRDNATSFDTRVGDGTSGVFLWGAQFEPGSLTTPYQRVGTTYDVTEAGVPSLGYLQFNGINNSMSTPTITPNIDKAQVFSGVRKLSDALRGKLTELGVGSGNGWFGLQAPNSNGANTYDFNSLGTSNQTATATGFVAPITNVLTGLADISGQSVSLRANGVVAAAIIGTQGTGNYLAYPLYIGARSGGGLPFNGQLFPLIVRFGTNLTAARITSTENWVATQTPLQWTVGSGFWNDAYPWSDISAWRD